MYSEDNLPTGEFEGYDFEEEERAENRQVEVEATRKRKPQRHTTMMTNLERFGDNGYQVDVVFLTDGIESSRQRMTYTVPAGVELDLRLNEEVPYNPEQLDGLLNRAAQGQ